MLSKSQRIPRSEFQNIAKQGRFIASTHFSLKYSPSTSSTRQSAISPRTQIAVSVSKKVSKSAVVRNRTRRRAYSALRDLLPHLKPGMYLFMAKVGADKLKGDVLRLELANLLGIRG
jgi:ribonuclease P protein component